MSLKLIGTTTSPYVRKVRVVLAEKKLDYQFVQDNAWEATTQVPQVNPLGQVPALVLDGKEALFDSRVIVEYLDTLSPVGKLIPPSGRERAEAKTWEALADGLLDAAVLVRLERTWAGRSEAQRCEPWMARQLDKVTRSLDAMEQRLGGTPYCMNNHLGLADIAVGVALGWLDFRFSELDWRAHRPHLQALYDKLAARPSFADTVPQ